MPSDKKDQQDREAEAELLSRANRSMSVLERSFTQVSGRYVVLRACPRKGATVADEDATIIEVEHGEY